MTGRALMPAAALAACLAGVPAHATTIGFDGLPGANGSAFTSTGEAGYLVTSQTGNWLAGQTYGNPPPYIWFDNPDGATSTTYGTIAVTDGGNAFTFASVDVYSSVTPIPWVFTGYDDGTQVFSTSGTQPNTFGDFATVANAFDADLVTTLEITLSCTLSFENPTGLDNIVVAQAAAVPEAPGLAVFATALAALGWARRAGFRKAAGAAI